MWRNPVKVQQIAQLNTQEITQEMRLILRSSGLIFTFSNINPDVTLIDIECEDQGKFTRISKLSFVGNQNLAEEQPNSYADIISEYGVPIAILALAILLIVLIMRKVQTASATLVPMNVQINQLLKEEE